jgi:hypothetical protein
VAVADVSGGGGSRSWLPEVGTHDDLAAASNQEGPDLVENVAGVDAVRLETEAFASSWVGRDETGPDRMTISPVAAPWTAESGRAPS